MGVQPGPSYVGSMAARNSVTWEGDHNGHIIRQNGGKEEVDGSNAEDVEVREVG